jgi:glutamate dehydrogenase (NAD(P)+)
MAKEENAFRNAQAQLDEAAELMGLNKNAHAILREPIREISVNIPVRKDGGDIEVFKGFRVQFNNARGPFKGGIRYHPLEDIDTIKALSAWMTWKTALANIPYGGGKGGIICDTKSLSQVELEALSRGYIRSLAKFIGPDIDVPAPDEYTNPQIMAWMADEYMHFAGESAFGVITGKPLEMWGSEGRFDSTALGGMYVLREAAKYKNINLKGAKVAIQGFGNAGKFAFDLASKLLGIKVVAISDSKGAVYSDDGLNAENLLKAKEETGSITGYEGAEKITNEQLLEADVDVLIPAATENQITSENADKIKAKILLELANGPVTPDADQILFERGVYDLPDFLVNSGGVIVSYFEWVQNKEGYYWDIEDVNSRLDRIITKSFWDVMKMQSEYTARGKKINARMAAYIIAVDRVAKTMKARGWY